MLPTSIFYSDFKVMEIRERSVKGRREGERLGEIGKEGDEEDTSQQRLVSFYEVEDCLRMPELCIYLLP